MCRIQRRTRTLIISTCGVLKRKIWNWKLNSWTHKPKLHKKNDGKIIESVDNNINTHTHHVPIEWLVYRYSVDVIVLHLASISFSSCMWNCFEFVNVCIAIWNSCFVSLIQLLRNFYTLGCEWLYSTSMPIPKRICISFWVAWISQFHTWAYFFSFDFNFNFKFSMQSYLQTFSSTQNAKWKVNQTKSKTFELVALVCAHTNTHKYKDTTQSTYSNCNIVNTVAVRAMLCGISSYRNCEWRMHNG